MSWTAIALIFFLALAMMVGPVLALRPNPRQRHIASLRAAAIERGLKVYIDSLHQEEIAVYQILWPTTLKLQYGEVSWCLVKQKHPHEMHFLGRWEWRGRVKPAVAVQTYLERKLESLPESVQALGSTPQGLCSYWNERGREAALDVIETWLKEARAELWPLVQQEVRET